MYVNGGYILKSQDIQFSQFYSSSTFINPAFAGSGQYGRLHLQQRLQWPKLSSKYVTSLIAYDHYFPEYKSGVGAFLVYDRQGSGTVSSFDLGMQYSYSVPLSENLVLKTGLQGTFSSKFVDYNKLTFDFQYGTDGTLLTPDNGIDANKRVFYADFSTGAIISSDKYWFGVTAHHLNTPDLSILNTDSPLPLRVAFITGVKINLFKEKGNSFTGQEHDRAILPVIHYKIQGKSDQLDVGIYGVYEHIVGGLWYRGIPVKKFEDFQNNESLVVMVGVRQMKGYEIRYSYDFTISTLQTARSGGAHELSLSILLRKYNGNKPMKRLPCPTHHPTRLHKFEHKQNTVF